MAYGGESNRVSWIGEPPSTTQFAAYLIVGVVGMMICGVQPVLLGALVAEKRLSAAGLGWATTAEFLTLGLGILAAGALLKPRRLRLIAIGSALVTGLADIDVPYGDGSWIPLNRAI